MNYEQKLNYHIEPVEMDNAGFNIPNLTLKK